MTEAECRQLHDKLDQIMYADLSSSERAELAETEDEKAANARECVEDQAWNRSGFECAMKATTEAELNRCMLAN